MTGELYNNSLKAQASWVRHVHPPDKVIFACGKHCRDDPRLDSVLIVPDLMRGKNKFNQRMDYRQATLRSPWALQWVWNSIQKTGAGSEHTSVDKPGQAERAGEAQGFGMRLATKPFDWWIIGDDDTFMNVPVLDRVLSEYKPGEPQVLSHDFGGGPGIAISRAAAGIFAQKFWDVFLPMVRDNDGQAYGDAQLIGFFMRDLKIKNVKRVDFTQYQPTVKQLEQGDYQKTYPTWHHAWRFSELTPELYERYVFGATSEGGLV
eukprot:CAMPEP_0179067524 /NCGR_PEP_ID=MMETSP0796-20121207/29531_1 /TAXON_ID=73915 /ORGANISM="Pyrodinium bahamense, Strain pbaha01" /LENGTH=261 /DNA_ID=CAMNT_0020764551 /DNA_START=67 /DNA_END=852 /DNA_ORIENTATION=+